MAFDDQARPASWFGPMVMMASSAERMRQKRARDRAGVAVLRLEVDDVPGLIDVLVAEQLIGQWDEVDQQAVADAVTAFLRRCVTRHALAEGDCATESPADGDS